MKILNVIKESITIRITTLEFSYWSRNPGHEKNHNAINVMMIESDSEKFLCHWTALKQLLVTEMSIVRKWIIVKSELGKKITWWRHRLRLGNIKKQYVGLSATSQTDTLSTTNKNGTEFRQKEENKVLGTTIYDRMTA